MRRIAEALERIADALEYQSATTESTEEYYSGRPPYRDEVRNG